MRFLRRALAVAVLVAAVLVVPAAGRADDPAPLRITVLGDSIAAGYDSQTGAYSGGFVPALAARLSAAGRPAQITNAGQPGATVAGVAATVDEVLADTTPDIVLLYIGTNDCRGVPDYPAGPSTPVALIGGKLRWLLSRILADAPAARVVVSRLILSSAQWPQINEQTLNAAVPSLPGLLGPRVSLADMSPISNVYLGDGIHPGVIGYSMMAWLWYLGLRAGPLPDLPPPAGVSPLTGQFPSHVWYAIWRST